MFNHLLHSVVDLFFSGEATEAETDARVGQILIRSNGSQNIGGFQGRRSTGAGEKIKLEMIILG